MMKQEPLPLERHHQARTLVTLAEGKLYEVATYDLRLVPVGEKSKPQVQELLEGYPFETIVYKAIQRDTGLSDYERLFGDYVFINESLRRDLTLGDLYLSRSDTQEAAALEHDNVVESFKRGDILLLTPDERIAVYGAGKDFI